MRGLTVLVIALMAIWGGYWVIGSRALDAAVHQGLQDLPAQGIPASYSDVRVRGFPNRFDLAITDPVIGPPGLQWQAPFFHLLALSYRPYHLIAVWPNSQSLDVAGQTLTLATKQARASVRFTPSLALPLDHMELVADTGTLTSSLGWQGSFAQLRFATRQTDVPNAHQIGLTGDAVSLDPALRAALDPTGQLPAAFDRLHLDATATLDRPLDREAMAGGAHLQSLTLSGLNLHWGPMQIDATGQLDRDDAGFASGKITLRLTDWPAMIARAEQAGLITPIDAGNLERGLQVLQTAGPDPGNVTVDLTFANGRISFAGLPLLPAPRF